MNNFLEKYGLSVSESGRKIDAALTKLGLAETPATAKRRRGRLMFGLDLTGSREASLQQARIATAAMFEAVKAIGMIVVKLAYYRGTYECRVGAWHDDPHAVSRFMQGLSCEGGNTQIARILRAAIAEPQHPDAVVFIGDHCEESGEDLVRLAEGLGKRQIPLFLFHECADHDSASLEAKPLFKRLAGITGGVYYEFKASSDTALRELLANVAAFSTAGKQGVVNVGTMKTPEGQQLQTHLLLLAAPESSKFEEER